LKGISQQPYSYIKETVQIKQEAVGSTMIILKYFPVFYELGASKFRLSSSPQRETGSGTHPASYPMGTGSSFCGGKGTGAWSWPLTPT